jgi:Flp pilus assembly protein TadB
VGATAPPGGIPLAAPLGAVTGSASLFAVPWALIVVVILVAGLIVGLWQFLRWRRRRFGETLADVADHARKEAERRLLGQSGKPSSAEPQGKA